MRRGAKGFQGEPGGKTESDVEGEFEDLTRRKCDIYPSGGEIGGGSENDVIVRRQVVEIGFRFGGAFDSDIEIEGMAEGMNVDIYRREGELVRGGRGGDDDGTFGGFLGV